MSCLQVKMEYDLASLSQQLKKLADDPTLPPEQINEELATDYENVYHLKNRRKKKKTKKQQEDERFCQHELSKILESMLLYAEKYHNVKKNLMRVADKIDSSEVIYSAFNPLVEKQLEECDVSEDGPNCETRILENVAALYQRMQSASAQIEQTFSFILENNVEMFECGSFAEKAVLFLLLANPHVMPLLAEWENYIQKQRTQTCTTLALLVSALPNFDIVRGFFRQPMESMERQEDDRGEDSDRQQRQEECQDNESDDWLLGFLCTAKASHRLETSFEEAWLRKVGDMLTSRPRPAH